MGRRGEISYVLAIDGKPLREGLSLADRDLKKFEGAVGRAVKSLAGTEKKAAYDMGVLTRAVRDMGGVAQLSAPQVDRLTQQVERLAKAGAKVPREFKQIEASIKSAQQAAAVRGAAGAGLENAAAGLAGRLGAGGDVLAAAGPAGLAAAAGLGAAAAAATAVAGALVSATQQAIAFEGVITSQAAATGLSVDALQRYDYIAGRTDATLEGVTTSIGYMQRALVESPEKFRAIGLEVEKLRALAPDKQFEAVASAINSIEDPAARTAARMELLGRSSSGIAKFIDEMDRWREVAAQMSLDQGAIDAVGNLGDALDGAGKSWERFWVTLGSEIAKSPEIVDAIETIERAIIRLVGVLKEKGPEIREAIKLAYHGMRLSSPALDVAHRAVAAAGSSELPQEWLDQNAMLARGRDRQDERRTLEAREREKRAADEAARKAAEERAKKDREVAREAERAATALKKAAEAAEAEARARGLLLTKLRPDIALQAGLQTVGLTPGLAAAVQQAIQEGVVKNIPVSLVNRHGLGPSSSLPSQVYAGPIGDHTKATAEAARSVFNFSTLLADATHVVELFGIKLDSTLGRITAGALAGGAAFQQIAGVFKNQDGTKKTWGQLSGADKAGVGLSVLSGGVQAYQSGSVLGGAMGMAGAGAALGSVVPGIGTAVGAVGGAVLGGILGLFGGGAQDRRRREEERNQATEKAASDLANLAQQIERLRMEKLQTGASGVAKVFEHLARAEGDVSDRMERMGRIGFAVFSALRAEGLSTVEAMKQLAPALDAALAAAEAQGTELTGSFGALAGFQSLVSENSELVETAEAYAGIFDALRSTGNLDEATFGDLQGELNAVFAELEDAGFSTNQALALIAPSLYQAAQAAEQLGIPLDENTQALVDQAEAAGLMEGMSDPMEDMVELLSAVVLIQAEMVRLWGGEIPDAIQKTIDKILAMPNPPIPGAGGAPSGGSGDGEVPYTGHPSQDYQPDLPRAAVGGVFRAPRRGGLLETHDVEAVIPLNNAPTGPGLAAFADEIAKRLGGGGGEEALYELADAVRQLAARPNQLVVDGEVMATDQAKRLERGTPAGRRLGRATRIEARS